MAQSAGLYLAGEAGAVRQDMNGVDFLRLFSLLRKHSYGSLAQLQITALHLLDQILASADGQGKDGQRRVLIC